MEMFKSKKSQSVAFAWVMGLVALFFIGVLYIVYSQVFYVHLAPVIVNNINSSDAIDASTKETTIDGINKYLDFFDAFPIIMVIVIMVFLFVVAIRREGESGFG